MSEDKLTRREREKHRQRCEMLDAAQALFSEKGYHNVTMHEIAKKAEFAIGTLYSFFTNKEDIYKTIVQDLSDTMHSALKTVLEGSGDEIAKLRQYIQVKTDILEQNLSFIKVFIIETRGMGYNVQSGLNDELRARYEKTLQRLATVFECGMNRYLFKKISEPYYLAIALDSTINSFLLLYVKDPAAKHLLDDPDKVLNIFFHGLLLKQVSQ